MELVSAAVALIVGVGAWVFAGLAYRAAQQSNRIAEDANRQSREANEVAKHANDLSEQANDIARAQADREVDPSHVEWVAKWDDEHCLVVLTNAGRDAARDLSVTVKAHLIDKLVRGEGDYPRHAQFLVAVPEIAERRAAHSNEPRRRQGIDPGAFVAELPFGITLAIDIRYRGQFGKPFQQQLQLYAR